MISTEASPIAREGARGDRPSFWRAFAVAWAVLAVLCSIWAMATPIGASPDEPAHIVKAASVARGQFVGTPTADGHRVTVPRSIARTQHDTCFAFHTDRTASCDLPPLSDPGAPTEATTTAGLYNPLYYVLVGWPTLLLTDQSGIYAMRIVSGILTSLFAALAFSVLWGLRRRALPLLGFATAVTPMLLFLGGSVNPNGVEATGTLAVFVVMLAVLLDRDADLLRRRAIILAVSGVVAVNARGLSPLWVLLAILLPLLLVPWRDVLALLRRPAVIIAAGALMLGAIAAVGWTLGSNSLLNAVENPDQTPQRFLGVGTNPLSGFYITLVRTVEYSHGLIGVFGWLDTPAPFEVLFAWSAFIGILLVAALVLLRSRALAFAWVLLAAFVLCPPLVQAAYITGGGIIWQGRYNMPLFLCLVVGLAVVLSGRIGFDQSASPWRRLALLVTVVLVAGQVYAFENTLRRYAVTPEGSMKQFLFGTPPWSPPGGTLLWLLLFTAVAVLAGWLILRGLRRSEAIAGTPAPVNQPAGN